MKNISCLVRDAVAGSAAALHELLAARQNRFCAIAGRFAPRGMAEDAVQEALMSLWSKFPTFRPGETELGKSFDAWAWAIVANAGKRLRRGEARRRMVQAADVDGEHTALDLLESREAAPASGPIEAEVREALEREQWRLKLTAPAPVRLALEGKRKGVMYRAFSKSIGTTPGNGRSMMFLAKQLAGESYEHASNL